MVVFYHPNKWVDWEDKNPFKGYIRCSLRDCAEALPQNVLSVYRMLTLLKEPLNLIKPWESIYSTCPESDRYGNIWLNIK
jgi:hypothetical protein